MPCHALCCCVTLCLKQRNKEKEKKMCWNECTSGEDFVLLGNSGFVKVSALATNLASRDLRGLLDIRFFGRGSCVSDNKKNNQTNKQVNEVIVRVPMMRLFRILCYFSSASWFSSSAPTATVANGGRRTRPRERYFDEDCGARENNYHDCIRLIVLKFQI